jgi:beta-galactosidase
MKTLSRRDLLKTSLLAPAAVAAQGMGPMGSAIEAFSQETRPRSVNAASNPSASGTYRERLLLDFGWRFHLGKKADVVRPLPVPALSRSGGWTLIQAYECPPNSA